MVETFLDETRRRQAERKRLREAGHAAAETLQRIAPIPSSADPTAPSKSKGRDWGVLGDVLGAGKAVGSAVGTALDVGNKYVTRPVLGAVNQQASKIGQGDPFTNTLEELITNPLFALPGAAPLTGGVNRIFNDDEERDKQVQQADSFTGAFDAAYEGKPWQRLATESILDPINLLGVGLVGKAAKVPRVAALAGRSGAAKTIIDNAVVFDDYLDRIQALPITVPLKVARKGLNKAFPKAFKQSDRAVVRGEANIAREIVRQKGSEFLDYEGEIARQSDDYIVNYLESPDIDDTSKAALIDTLIPAKLGRAYDNADGLFKTQIATRLADQGLFEVDAGGLGLRVNADGTGVKTAKLEAYETVDSVADVKQLGEDERALYSGILDMVAVALYSTNPRRFGQLDDAYETAGKIVAVHSSDKSTILPGVQGEFRGAFNTQTGTTALSPTSDITTLVHELLGHVLAENMSPDDLARMRAYFGDVTDPATQERFAEAIEGFMRTGNVSGLPAEVADVILRYRQHASLIDRQGIPAGQFPSGARGAGAKQTIGSRVSGISSQPQAPNPQVVSSTGGFAFPGQSSPMQRTPPASAPGQRPLPGFFSTAPVASTSPRVPKPPTAAATRAGQVAQGQTQLDATAPFAFPANIWQRQPYKRLPRASKTREAGRQAARTVPFTAPQPDLPTTPMLGTSERIDPRTLGQQAAREIPFDSTGPVPRPAEATPLPENVTEINVPGQVPTQAVPAEAADARNKLINYSTLGQAEIDAMSPQQVLDEMKRLQTQWTDEAQTAADEVRNLRRQAQQFEAGTKNRTRFDPMIKQVRDRYNTLQLQLADLLPAIDDLETRLASPLRPSLPRPVGQIPRSVDRGVPTTQELPEPTPEPFDPTAPTQTSPTQTPSGVPVQAGLLPQQMGSADFLPYLSSYLRNSEDILIRQEEELTRLREMEETAIDPAELDAVKEELDRAQVALRDAQDLAETNEGSQQMVTELQQRLDAAAAEIETIRAQKGLGPGEGEGLGAGEGDGFGEGFGEGLGVGEGGAGTGIFNRERVYARVGRRLDGPYETFVTGETPNGDDELAAMKASWDEWTGFGRAPEVDEEIYQEVRNRLLNNARQPESRGGLKKDGTPKKPKGSAAGQARRLSMAKLRDLLLGSINSNPEILAALHRLHREGVVTGLNNKGQVTLSADFRFQDDVRFQSAATAASSQLSSGNHLYVGIDGIPVLGQYPDYGTIFGNVDHLLYNAAGKEIAPNGLGAGTWLPQSLADDTYYLVTDDGTGALIDDVMFEIKGGVITNVKGYDALDAKWIDYTNHDPSFDTNFDLNDLAYVKQNLASQPLDPVVDKWHAVPTTEVLRESMPEQGIMDIVDASEHALTERGFEKLIADNVYNRDGGKLNRAVRHYTSDNYQHMNAAARGEHVSYNSEPRTKHLVEDDWKTLTRELDEYIRQRPPIGTPLTTFRGIRMTGRVEEAIERLGVGTTFVEDGYTSTSALFSEARKFAGGGNRAYIRVNLPETAKFAIGFPNEYEFILPRGALYEIKGIGTSYDGGGSITFIDVDYLGSAATGEISGSSIAGSNITLGNVESQFRDAIFQSKNSPHANIFSTSDFGGRLGAQEPVNTGRVPQSVDTPTTETTSPLRRDASTGEALGDVANKAGIQPGSTGEVFVKNLLTEHISENPTQFQAIELSSPRAAGMLADAMRAADSGDDAQARDLTAQAMRRINQQQISFGMLMPRAKKILDTLLPDNKTLLNNTGTRAFGRHDLGTTAGDREIEVMAKARSIPSIVKAREQYDKIRPLVEETLNDISNAGNPVPPFGETTTTIREVIEARKFANANQQKVIDSFLKVFNGSRVDDKFTMREALAETVVTKYHREMAKRMGFAYDKTPSGIGKAWMNLTKGWREQALFSIRYHAVNGVDLLVRSSIYGVNPTLGRSADRRSRRWGIEIPHDIEIKGYEAEGLRDGLDYDERAGPALGKLPVVGQVLGPMIRFNRELSKAMENSARKAGWAKTVEDHLQQQIMPRMGEEIDRVAGPNAQAVKEMLTASEGNLSAQDFFDAVVAKGGTAEQATELSTLWSRGLNEASDRGREFSNAVYFNYSSDIRNIEESLKAFQFLPFHFWATRNIPFYLDTLAANPELARLWQTYDQISDEEREGSGLTARVRGMLPVDVPLPDILFGPGSGYFNPLVALSLADQTKPRYTPDDATGVGKLLNEAGRIGLGPAPWVVIPLTIGGVYGDRAEAPDPLRHSRLTEATLDRFGLGGLKVSPVKSAVRGAQEFVTGKEQFTFTGSTYKDRAVATRLAEMSIERTGQANHPEYVMAASDPTSPLFQQALANVNRSQFGRELYGFTSPVPMTVVPSTEQAIRSDRKNLEQQHGGEIPPEEWRRLADAGAVGTGYSRFGGDARGRQVFAGFNALDGVPRTWSALREQQTNQAFPFYAQYLLWLQTRPQGADRSVDAFLKAS